MSKENHLLGHSMEWRINTPQFLKEVFESYPGSGGIFYQPINILRVLLDMTATRAGEINDPVLNALMCRLSLYAVSDPYDKVNYDRDQLTAVLSHPEYLKWKKENGLK